MVRRADRAAAAAAQFMTAMTRLRARLRTESAPTEMPWTWSQLTTLARIVQEGETTTSALAQAEHVRRQSMAETLTALHDQRLIKSTPDPDDGRKVLIRATREGHALADLIPAARKAWLGRAFEELLEPSDLQILVKAAALMNRLADSTV